MVFLGALNLTILWGSLLHILQIKGYIEFMVFDVFWFVMATIFATSLYIVRDNRRK
jgi:hypothetical protein